MRNSAMCGQTIPISTGWPYHAFFFLERGMFGLWLQYRSTFILSSQMERLIVIDPPFLRLVPLWRFRLFFYETIQFNAPKILQAVKRGH